MKLLAWVDRHAGVLLAILLAVFVLITLGCGSERNEQQNTVEQETWEIGPLSVETPIGTFVAHKTGAVRKLGRYRTTTEQQHFTFPEAREIGGAILGGLTGPLAGGGLVGLAMAWLMRRSAAKAAAEKSELEAEKDRNRQALDQTVAGVEAAKAQMPPESVDVLHNSLSKTMDAAAKASVRNAKARLP